MNIVSVDQLLIDGVLCLHKSLHMSRRETYKKCLKYSWQFSLFHAAIFGWLFGRSLRDKST
jgi:hypothetical protein